MYVYNTQYLCGGVFLVCLYIGVEFPAQDLDALAPIYTPHRVRSLGSGSGLNYDSNILCTPGCGLLKTEQHRLVNWIDV